MMTKEADPFSVLEEKVNQLMVAYDVLKKEKTALEEQMAHLQTLEEKVARLHQEREAVREKIENLLGRLDRLILSTR